MRLRSLVTVGLAALTPGGIGPAPTAAQEVTISGQVRPRFEYRDPVEGGLDDFTSMRVRLGADAVIDDGLSVFAQIQDVRIWGEETHPLFDYAADALDLHQGYLRFTGDRWRWLTATIGRMETSLGGERLVGAVGWSQQGQSFDGLRFDVGTERTSWALLAFAVNDETAPGIVDEEELYGAYGTVRGVGPGALDLYWLYDRVSGAVESDEHLLGGRYVFDVADGSVSGRFEATLETGTRSDADVEAFMLGGRLGAELADRRLTLTLWYDYLSGDDPATSEIEVFNTLYATNHKFYGLADLFLNIPVHTGGAGLQDLAAKLSYRLRDQLAVGLDAHSFRAVEGAGLTESRLAEELDVTVTHRYSAHLATMFGVSYVFKADGLAEIGRLAEDMTWLYVMMEATF